VNEQTLFAEALERTDPQDRAAFLDEACQCDPALRGRLERLLAQHQRAGSFLESSPVTSAPTINEPPETPGTVIGPYKLLEQIGEGGFGVVFMAEQMQPVRRRVALKVLKPGMDTKHVIARFEAERQALALMDHPNIAKVFDGGATPSGGRPYFVMELVRGVLITDYCDQNHLTLRQRLELFIPVCHAVQHAHLKGLIHRDLKPSNVLVTLNDARPVPKIIDFGISKAMGQQLTDETLHTGFAQLVGTPMYMSPEQAALSGMDVDTRSDIYSLGVLLYELLTGTTPFDSKRLKEASYDDMRRIIREEEPPRPSTRVSTLAQESTVIASQRRSDARQLSHLFKGELDWIVLKCLEKDRNRRYETASALATDIERYLHDEPVSACPPSSWYRLHKFARRNRGAMLAGALVSAALLVTVIVLTVSMVLIAQERDRAQQAAENESQKAQEAEKERQRAERNLQRAREAVDRFFTRTATEMKDQPHMEKIRRALLEDALKFYQGFLEEKGTDPVIRHETARAYLRVAQVQNALSNTSQAEAPGRSAIALLKQLVADYPASKEYRQDLAEAHVTLAGTLGNQGRQEEALSEYRKELAVWEQMVADFPGVADYRRRVADGHAHLGHVLHVLIRNEEAEKEYRRAQSLVDQIHRDFPSEPEDANRYCGQLGDLFVRMNRLPEAEHEFREAARLEVANKSGYTARLDLADVLVGTGKSQEAEQVYRDALAAAEKLLDDFLGVPGYRHRVWWINARLARRLFVMNRTQEGEEAHRRGLAILEKMLADQPRDLKLLVCLSETYKELGLLLYTTNRSREAVDAFRRAQELYEKAIVGTLQKPAPLLNLAEFLANCPAPQFRDPTRAAQLAQKVLQRWPSSFAWSTFGSALYQAGKWNEAIAAIQKAVEFDNGGRAWDWLLLAMAHWQRGDVKEARKWYDKAIAGMQKTPSYWLEEHWVDQQLRQAEAAALLGVAKQPKATENALPAGKK
jgi:serine/threonine protein kinase